MRTTQKCIVSKKYVFICNDANDDAFKKQIGFFEIGKCKNYSESTEEGNHEIVKHMGNMNR